MGEGWKGGMGGGGGSGGVDVLNYINKALYVSPRPLGETYISGD
jgi:hypothetical protein